MSVREAMNNKKGLGVAVGAVLIGAAAVMIGMQAKDLVGKNTGVYFSDENGQNLFGAGMSNLPPFQHGGMTAVRAHVFKCEGKQFIAYVSKFTPSALEAINEAKASKGTGKPPAHMGELISSGTTGTLIKRPTDKEWVSQADTAKADKIRIVRCKDNSTPEELDP